MSLDLAGLLQQYLNASGGAGQQSPVSGSPLDLSSLLGSNNTSGILNEVNKNLGSDQIIGGNQNVMSMGGQTGGYGTASNTTGSNLGVTSGSQNTQGDTATSNNGFSSGMNTGTNQSLANTGNTSSTGQLSNTSGQTTAIDSLGLGSALQSMIPSATTNANNSNAFLTNLMQNGNPAYQQQMNSAISNSLSGPGMTGVGNEAMGRVAGAAASNVAMNDMGQRLQAAGQLAGPNSVTTLAGAGNPFIGQASQGSGATQGVSNESGYNATSGTQVGSNYANTGNVGNTSTSGSQNNIQATGQQTNQTNTGMGVATGASGSVTQGQTPTSSSSGGGCYVCSIFAHLGKLHHEGIERAVRFKLHRRKDLRMALGYSVYGPWLARQVLKHKFVRRPILHLARAVLYEELRLASGLGRVRAGAWTAHFFFHAGSSALGLLAKPFFKPDTRDAKIRNLLAAEGLLIPVYEPGK